jgi:type II secretory pathway pseudopilin PulG
VALVEVLLVLVLIGLLAGLVLTAVWTAGGAAKRAMCANQMRQLASALVMYRDRFGAFPPSQYAVNGDDAASTVTWADVLAATVGDKNMFCCPSSSKSGGAGSPEAPVGGVRSSYAYLRGASAVSVNGRPEPEARWDYVRSAATREGALLVCGDHEQSDAAGRPLVLVAYEDGSVRWQRVPEYLAAPSPAADGRPMRRWSWRWMP